MQHCTVMLSSKFNNSFSLHITDIYSRFFRYFRTYDAGMREQVARRYFAVSDECSGKTRHSTTYCSDALKLCKTDYISVTLGTQITTCDLYWRFPTLTFVSFPHK